MSKFMRESVSCSLIEYSEWRYIDEAEILTRLCNRVINLALVGSSFCKYWGHL